ncbi:hypothetical protein N7494_004386 [Penicillium frequentans]|uniref:NmrA-like domain-containing protein n=1 Tax=Penicillium frequentans TaxID=3151616 RepID=A0AAD6D0I9_9EURO|nr:hypothetical protein N7494_004386 [Penicillium glabrum]
MSKLITVFGATGKQGGSFKIRGITRDTTKKFAQNLAQKGVEVVTADLDSVDSLTAALKGSHTVFLVTNYWETINADVEYFHGMD